MKPTKPVDVQTGRLVHLDLPQIVPAAANPRQTINKDDLAELTRSIDKNGLLQPIAVRPLEDKFEIIGGHRRFYAVRELARKQPDDLRWKTIAAQVMDAASERVAAMRLAENINRANLSPLEISEGIADAIENGMSQADLADSLGWKERNVHRYRQFHEARHG